jgi:hypothetical protein
LSTRGKKRLREGTYHPIKVIIVVIIVIVIVIVIVIFRENVVFEGLAGEIVDSTRYDLRISEHVRGMQKAQRD